ncbi:MAG: DUF3168 domain-containing protein [Hyphomicrobium sp.]|jgi:hypothetical protein|nr:DUF3168 domain-containing protein [Hyphomicrobium sp.]
MMSAGFELQKAVFAKLAGDAQVLALLGGARIYNDVPRGARLPYVTIGESTMRDWSTDSEGGHEHFLSILVWSRANGEREVHQILSAIEVALDGTALSLPGFRLVNLRHEFSEIRREADGETSRGLMRLRAVTEPV